MKRRPIRIGLVGAGFVGSIHARGYRRLADLGVEIVAVAAVPLAQAEDLAAEFGVPHVCDDYRRVLERPDVDIVDLCVPNHLHEPFVVATAQAGKHIICEKPLTGYYGGPGAADPVGATPKRLMLEAAVGSADRMLAAANAAGVRLMYAENWLYAPAVQKALRLAQASRGAILEIRAQECHSGSHAAYAKTWKYAGGGALARLGPHPIGTAVFLKWQEGLQRGGAPIQVQAVTAEVGNLSRIPALQAEPQRWLVDDWQDVENWVTVLLTFQDGARATIFASDTVLGGMEDTLDIYLSNGRVRCDMTHSTMMQAYAPSPEVFASEYLAEKLETKAGWSYPSIDEEWLLGYPQELRDFVEAIAEEREPLSTPQLGREVVQVMYAAYLAAEEGRRVTLR
ncbi:MAG: Gfo/Idh/MocA family oxidoreductase [Chloroflexi bacterium]|nr:Gfo/Idh/MocA family oxidoreductase [Chloroflexota bacterium]